MATPPGSNAEHEQNRSSAFTPEQLAAITAQTSKLVQETVAAVFASLGPALREMNKPYEDPKKAARQRREMMLFKQDEEERLTNERRMKDACTHLDPKGQTSIRLIRNFFDRQPRGICVLCHDLITPREWRIGPPDEDNPRGVPFLAPAHKDYGTVRHIAAHE